MLDMRNKTKKTGLNRDHPRGIRIKWLELRPLFDYWGAEIKRYYQLETLAYGVERVLSSNKQNFITQSAQSVLGPAPLVSLTFELFQEGAFQLIFRLRASNIKRKSAVFAFVAAKDAESRSRVAAREHANLRKLYRRAPESVVRPYEGGVVFLPDRLGRGDRGRRVYAYLTQWLPDFHELGVDHRTHQFFMNTKTPHRFTIAQTEEIKQRIIEIMARAYDPKTFECMELPQVASGDFVVTAPDKGRIRVKLIACRRIRRRVSPAQFIHEIASASWEWGQRSFRLMPNHPGTLYAAFVNAVGEPLAQKWFGMYRDALQD